jgi:hypothetical protein
LSKAAGEKDPLQRHFACSLGCNVAKPGVWFAQTVMRLFITPQPPLSYPPAPAFVVWAAVLMAGFTSPMLVQKPSRLEIAGYTDVAAVEAKSAQYFIALSNMSGA